jgi:hypothetical protein
MKLSSWQVAGTIAFTLLIVSAAPHVRAEAANPGLEFVTEYIRQLSAQENIRADGEKELAGASTPNDQFTSFIHAGTAMQIELQTEIQILNGMPHFNPPFDTLVPTLTEMYQRKFDWYQRLIDICATMLGSPKPGVDYGALVAEVPKVRAFLESEDQTLLPITTLAFGLLIDERPDSKNHASHLLITKAERSDLLHSLAAAFGPKLDEKNPNYVVGSAVLLKGFLSKNFKCADEPWE